MSDLEKLRFAQMADPEFCEYALKMEPLAELSKALIGARLERNLTQKELATITGIPQAEISRMESCKKSPSLRTLQRIAAGLDMQLKIVLVPRTDVESFTRWEKMLQLRENLLDVEEDRALGREGCSIDELDSFLGGILNEG